MVSVMVREAADAGGVVGGVDGGVVGIERRVSRAGVRRELVWELPFHGLYQQEAEDVGAEFGRQGVESVAEGWFGQRL